MELETMVKLRDSLYKKILSSHDTIETYSKLIVALDKFIDDSIYDIIEKTWTLPYMEKK